MEISAWVFNKKKRAPNAFQSNLNSFHSNVL